MNRETTTFVYVTYIATTPEKLFAAITDPALSRQYWGHENVSEWKPGAKWEHVRADAARNVGIAGNVVEVTAPKRLVVSWSSPADYADTARHSRATFDIEPYKDMVRLTVTHEDLEKGSGMEKGVTRGWPIVLSSLKSFLETGRAIDIFAKPLAA